jgi:hypothetical protein
MRQKKKHYSSDVSNQVDQLKSIVEKEKSMQVKSHEKAILQSRFPPLYPSLISFSFALLHSSPYLPSPYSFPSSISHTYLSSLLPTALPSLSCLFSMLELFSFYH